MTFSSFLGVQLPVNVKGLLQSMTVTESTTYEIDVSTTMVVCKLTLHWISAECCHCYYWAGWMYYDDS